MGLAIQELAELPLLTLVVLKLMNLMVQQALHEGVLFRRSHLFGGLKGASPCEEFGAFMCRGLGVSKVQFLAM